MHSIFLLLLLFVSSISSGNICLNKEDILPRRNQDTIVPTPLILQRLSAINQLISDLPSEEIYDPNFLFAERGELCYSSHKPTESDKALTKLLQIQKNLFDLLPHV